MNNDYRRTFGRLAAGLLAIAAVLAVGRAAHAEIAADDSAVIDGWPSSSKLQAQAMIEKYGQPQRHDEQSLTWFGLFNGEKTVVHRVNDGGPAVEEVVLYRVPDDKIAKLAEFDDRIVVNKDAGEMSALSNDSATDLLLLNLAHEIVSGFRTVDSAKDFYQKQTQLAESGKSSRYRDGLIFEEPASNGPVGPDRSPDPYVHLPN